MYTLVRAVVKPRSNENRWVDKDIANIKMVDLYKDYRKVYAVLSNPFIEGNVTLNIEEIQSKYAVSEITFSQMLVENGNLNLPTSYKLPNVANRFARYVDAFMAGYKISPANIKKAHDVDIPLGDKESLFMTKKKLDYSEFKKYCLVAVNGYFHYTDATSEGIWVVDGMKSNFHCKHNTAGIVSFKELGSIESIPIKREQVYKLSEEMPLYKQAIIDVGKNIENKTVILIIGGYMHVLDRRVYNTFNDTSIAVRLSNLPLVERFHESREWLDLSVLPYEKSSNNDSAINREDFLSDENILAYLTLPQSFVVLLDNSEIYVEREYVRRPPTPKLLISFKKPEWPLFHKTGKFANYWPVEEQGQWGLHVVDNQWSRRQYETINHGMLEAMDDNEQTDKPVELSRAYFLKIGTDIKID